MLHEIFSDAFASKKNYLTEIDARIKMLFVFAAIAVILSSTKPYLPLALAVSFLTFLTIAGIPLKIILLRLIAPFGVTITVLAIQIFFYGETPLFELHLLGINLTGYEEGARRGILIVGKVLGTVSLIIFLNMTTSLNKLLGAARWLKIPYTWVEIAMLSYRYIFVLLEDAITIRDAQKVRLGYNGLRRSLQSIGKLAGATVIRAYDQSVSTYEAMMLRGYSGKTCAIACEEKLKAKDRVTAFISIVVLGLLLILNKLF